MKTCLIVSGGEFNELPEAVESNFIIACDKGYGYCQRLGLIPDTVIGDYDSMSLESIEADLKKRGLTEVKVLRFPSHKDDSDTMLAVKHALDMGFDNIVITCALGGRFDHSFANIQSMAYAVEHGASCCLYGGHETLYVIKNGSLTLKVSKDRALSVFSLSDESKHVIIRGALYEAENITLTNRFPLGLSNLQVKDSVTVSVGEGMLLVIESDL